MSPLNPDFDLERYFARLGRSRDRVLLLDYDGTLAPFHKDPRLALPYPQVARVLREVARTGATRIVLVTGRRLEDLRRILPLVPRAEIWASHGWERMAATGESWSYLPSRAALGELQRAEAPARRLAEQGVRVERKVASLAVHWRGLVPTMVERVRRALDEAWCDIGGDCLALLPFDGGLELRAHGRDKGDAVREAMSGCASDAVCAYLGDDLTDEDAFEAIRERGLGVLVRAQHRRTSADLWLSPRELTAFLERWGAAAGA